MALITCPECKKQISSYAIACPNCGMPKTYIDKFLKERGQNKEPINNSKATKRNDNLEYYLSIVEKQINPNVIELTQGSAFVEYNVGKRKRTIKFNVFSNGQIKMTVIKGNSQKGYINQKRIKEALDKLIEEKQKEKLIEESELDFLAKCKNIDEKILITSFADKVKDQFPTVIDKVNKNFLGFKDTRDENTTLKGSYLFWITRENERLIVKSRTSPNPSTEPNKHILTESTFNKVFEYVSNIIYKRHPQELIEKKCLLDRLNKSQKSVLEEYKNFVIENIPSMIFESSDDKCTLSYYLSNQSKLDLWCSIYLDNGFMKADLYKKPNSKEIEITYLLNLSSVEIAIAKTIRHIEKYYKTPIKQDDEETKEVVVKKMSLFDLDKNRCSHILKEKTLKIPGKSKSGSDQLTGPYKLLYCPICKTYYIKKEDLRFANSIGTPLIRLKSLSSDKDPLILASKEAGFLKEASDLKIAGYTVEQNKDPGSVARMAILNAIIEANILTKDRVISYLEWFIRRNRNFEKMETAIYKWQCDLEYLKSKN